MLRLPNVVHYAGLPRRLYYTMRLPMAPDLGKNKISDRMGAGPLGSLGCSSASVARRWGLGQHTVAPSEQHVSNAGMSIHSSAGATASNSAAPDW
jgi:hypothetical protein